MPQELPGFYYDAVKNRYFPLKGRIPGSSRPASCSDPDGQNPKKAKISQGDNCDRIRVRTHQLLQGRELNGNVVPVRRSKIILSKNTIEHKRRNLRSVSRGNDFQGLVLVCALSGVGGIALVAAVVIRYLYRGHSVQLYTLYMSRITVWRYRGSERMSCDGGLDETSLPTQTSNGVVDGQVLVGGGQNNCLSIIEVQRDGQRFDYVLDDVVPDRLWPAVVPDTTDCSEAPKPIGIRLTYFLDSAISSVKLFRRNSYRNDDLGYDIQHGLLTTLGSDTAKGAVYILNLAGVETLAPPSKIASVNGTIWTADSNSNASEAVIGTSKGAATVRLETGTLSWLYRGRSDVLAQQLDKQGNVVLCGLRNGNILTVDTRVTPGIQSGRRVGHRVNRNTVCMPSSVCSLVSLQLYDQYFFASSMDGAIKLYDHRMMKRGAVQVYEGHVNSHSRLQLRVDPTERFLMAGGEDCHLRLWSIKSSERLFDEQVSDEVPSSVCWQKGNEDRGSSGADHPTFRAWCGFRNGLIYASWS